MTHPQLMLRAHMAPLATIVEMLRSGDASLGIALDDRVPPDIVAEQVGKVGFVCLLPRGHPLCEKTELSLKDLAGEKLISYRATTRPADELACAARSEGFPLCLALEIDASLSAVGFVQVGLGVAVVDGLLPWSQFSGVAVIPLAHSPHFPISVLTSRSRALSMADEMALETLRATCSAILPRLTCT